MTSGGRRPVVLVNGLPAAGKSTLAAPLAAELGLPLFARDMIKETIADMVGTDAADGRPRREWNAALGATSAETVWTLLSHAYSGAVLESNFSRAPDLTRAGLRRASVHQTVEIWCDVPVELARERYARRATSRHPIHQQRPGDPEEANAWWHDQNHPLGDGPLLRVDTTSAVDVAKLAARCRELLANLTQHGSACPTERT